MRHKFIQKHDNQYVLEGWNEMTWLELFVWEQIKKHWLLTIVISLTILTCEILTLLTCEILTLYCLKIVGLV